jgi:hypothetical protein
MACSAAALSLALFKPAARPPAVEVA